jgi:hypothetical protein
MHCTITQARMGIANLAKEKFLGREDRRGSGAMNDDRQRVTTEGGFPDGESGAGSVMLLI